MPPGPGYNWICVLSGAAEVIGHVARYRASQVTRLPRDGHSVKRAASASLLENDWKGKIGVERLELKEKDAAKQFMDVARHPPTEFAAEITPEPKLQSCKNLNMDQAKETVMPSPQIASIVSPNAVLDPSFELSRTELSPEVALQPSNAADTQTLAEPADHSFMIPEAAVISPVHKNTLQSSKVPSSKLGRLFHYGGLAASLGYGAASEFLRPSNADDSNRSVMLTDANISRLVSKLSQMRGAALKLGQFLSIQDTHLLPKEIDAVFRRVQDSAHYMPDWQMEQVLTSSLGPSWSTKYFASFDRIPFAAASIGQVHEGVLKAEWSPTGQQEKVAVKVQFPNIRDSISADLSYITWLLRVTLGGRILPKGLFLDRTMEVMKAELADECNYVREAHYLQQFRSPDFLGNDSRFHIPWASSISSDKVLVMEFVEGGVSLGSDLVTTLPQEQKDKIATTILHLCLLELFRFGTMQTDPNYSNFLYIPDSGKIALIDFGATREYGPEFLDGWRRLLEAAASVDLNSSTDPDTLGLSPGPAWDACVEESISLGYLVGPSGEGEGFESPEMVAAHVTSLAFLAHPFNSRTPQPVRFGKGSDFGRNTERIRNELIPVMLRERKKGPPRETYSLNRKLSGAFLLASRLGSTIHARDIWEDVLNIKY